MLRAHVNPKLEILDADIELRALSPFVIIVIGAARIVLAAEASSHVTDKTAARKLALEWTGEEQVNRAIHQTLAR